MTTIKDTEKYTCESAEDFKAARKHLGKSRLDFGRLLGYKGDNIENQIRLMETGKRCIKAPQIRLVELYVVDEAFPPDWDEPMEIDVIEGI